MDAGRRALASGLPRGAGSAAVGSQFHSSGASCLRAVVLGYDIGTRVLATLQNPVWRIATSFLRHRRRVRSAAAAGSVAA